jgi:hypothetical protein
MRRTLVAGLVLGGLLLAGLLTGVSVQGAPPDPALVRDEAKYAAAQEILQRRTEAVVRGDREMWLADLDPRATQFRAQQEVVWDNLQQLKLAGIGYELQPVALDVPEADSRYSAPTFTPAVVFRYRLDGMDAGNVARPMAPTFVLRGGTWRLASESDAVQLIPSGAEAEPWLRVPVEVHRRGSVLVLTDIGDERAQRLLTTAESALAEVRTVVPAASTPGLVLYATSDTQSLTTYLDPTAGQRLEWIKAAAVPTFADVEEWLEETPAGSPTGSRIVWNQTTLPITDPTFDRVIVHEATHAATHALVTEEAPRWVVEGYAEWVAYKDRPETRRTDADFERALSDPGFPSRLPGDGRFFLGPQTLNYTISWQANRYIAERYGEGALNELFVRLARVSDKAQTGAQQKQAFAEVLGVSEAELLADFRSWLRS